MFKIVNCPRCKVEHETYLHAHHVFNDLRCDDCCVIDLEVGQKAILYYNGEKRSGVIAEIDDNLCGDYCCQGYRLKGDDRFYYKEEFEGIYE